MKTLMLLIALALAASAQVSYRFSATTGDVVLAAAGTKLTIQQPDGVINAGKLVTLETAIVYCSVACDVTQAQNGAAATTTAGTANALLPNSGIPAAANIFTASNVGSGVAVAGIVHLAAASTMVFDLSRMTMGNTGTRANYTVIISSISGTANITLIWREQ